MWKSKPLAIYRLQLCSPVCVGAGRIIVYFHTVSFPICSMKKVIVLEYRFTHYVKAGLSLHWAHIQCRILLSYWCMFHFNEPRLEKTAQLVC